MESNIGEGVKFFEIRIHWARQYGKAYGKEPFKSRK